LKIEFWGVRGSFPSPGIEYCKYGGHTTCVNIIFEKDLQLILDAGLGIQKLGKKLLKKPLDQIQILWTHFHWDHIQGLPFFPQIYIPGQKIDVYSGFDIGWQIKVSDQMNGIQFPIEFDALPSDIQIHSLDELEKLTKHKIKVEKMITNHPGGCYAYKIIYKDKIVIFCPDNELMPPQKPNKTLDEFVNFFKDADVLIHDTQYLDKEMEIKKGWGHSSIGMVCDVVEKSNVKHFVAFHHDPIRTDDELDKIEKDLRKRISKDRKVDVAKEGLEIIL
tara:strand:- start:2731 stop:3558 length:828 start_codon:yes stop_codon:yes gene_type:complete